jgi:hypothetical protein
MNDEPRMIEERAERATSDGRARPMDARAIEEQIGGIREDLGLLLGELDRRRHELLDWRVQLRKNAVPIAIAAVGIAALGGGAVAWTMHRQEVARRPTEKARALGRALDRAMRHPNRVAGGKPHPASSLGYKVLSAAGTALAAILARQIGEAIFAPAKREVVHRRPEPEKLPHPDDPSTFVVT